MTLIINGESKEFAEGTSLQNVITSLHIEDKVMAAAVNMQIVKKDEWCNHQLCDSDTLELLQFVGGG